MELDSYSDVSELLNESAPLAETEGFGIRALVFEDGSKNGAPIRSKLFKDTRVKIVRYEGRARLGDFILGLKQAVLSGRHLAIELSAIPSLEVITILKRLANARYIEIWTSPHSRESVELSPSQRVYLVADRAVLSALSDTTLLSHFSQTLSL